MSVQSAIQKLQDELQRRFRIAGRGSVTRVQEKLQLGGGYFRDLRRPERQRLDLRVLVGALEVLGVEHAEFFSSVFGSADPVDSFLAEAAELRRKMRRPPQILKQIEDLADRPAARGKISPLDSETLEQFDALRRDSPREAMRQIRQAISMAPANQLPRLLGSYGSACRFAGRTDEAQVVVAKAISLANEAQDLVARADLLQRAAYIVGARIEHERALTILEKAIITYAQLGDTVGIGRVLIDQGNSYSYLGHHEKALTLYQRGLDLLPENVTGAMVTSRVSAQFNLAVACMELDRLDDAMSYAAEARKGIASQGKIAEGKTVWLEASIAKAQGHQEKTETFLSQALEIFRDLDPLTAALVAVDLVRAQLYFGKPLKAYATAKAMISLLKPLESHPIAAVAITDMARCALEGKGLTEEFLEKVTSGLQKEAHSSQKSKKR